ncbi:MAG: type II secretion system F family protein [Candidatus Brocadiia bacterium]
MGKLSRKQLIYIADTLATMLDAGVPLVRALDVVATQSRGRVSAVAGRIRASVEGGDTLAEAMARTRAFPDLFLRLTGVGEASGTLDRTFAEVARLYEFQGELVRGFLARVALPAIEYIAAIAIVALVYYILNLLGVPAGRPTTVLLLGYGVPVGLILAYVMASRLLGGTRPLHEILLRIPVLGKVFRNIALARFSLVMELASEAGIRVTEGLECALRATGNAAFSARSGPAVAVIEEGEDLTSALRRAGLFPWEYLEIVRIAEESGTLAKRFEWLAQEYADRARTALRVLVAVLARLIWLGVAAVIIINIFRLFSLYADRLGRLAP